MSRRFVVDEIDDDSECEPGNFPCNWVSARWRQTFLVRTGAVRQDEGIGPWFSENLEKPTRFATAKAPFYGKQNNAISWFKDDAVEHLSRIRTRVAILQSHGVSVKALKTDRAGYIVHEDECQIVAEPFQGEQS